MPPLNYLEGNQQDVYALNRLGSTFSDMVVGLQLNRMRQQQFLANQALERARLQIEREKQQTNELTERAVRARYGAETDYRKAQANTEQYNLRSLQDQGQAGGELGDALKALTEVDPQRNPDVANFLRAIAIQQSARVAATNPQNIAHQTAQLMQLNDPMIRNLIATGTHSVMPVPRGGQLFDVGTKSPLAYNRYEADPGVVAAEKERANAAMLSALGRNLGERTGLPEGPERSATLRQYNRVLSGPRLKARNKEGVVGYIPASQRQDAISEGYTILGEEE